MINFSIKRLIAFIKKEGIQIIRDPSSLLIAVVLPLILLFLFGYGVSLDVNKIKIGLLVEDDSDEARSLVYSFMNTKYFDIKICEDRKILEEEIISTKLRGIIIIPQDFSKLITQRDTTGKIQVIADGSEPNIANFIQNYADGILMNWLQQRASDLGQVMDTPIIVQERVWFNPDLKSHNMLLPGAIAVIMSLIGVLLTALVIAREWERGTMEAIMATPVSIAEIVIGKILPYYFLGVISAIICFVVIIGIFQVPFRGSFLLFIIVTSIFLFATLCQGLLISTLTRNQFLASQISIIIGFLPSQLLSGFIFEINSIPKILQFITYILPQRYFITILKTIFLTGNVWKLILPNMLAMLIIAMILLSIIVHKTVKRLE